MEENFQAVGKTDAQDAIKKLMAVWQQAKFKQKQSRKPRQVAALSQTTHKGYTK